MEIILAQNHTSDNGYAYIKAIVDENDKIIKIIAESVGDGWCGFQVQNSIYNLQYGYNDYKELIIDDEYYLIDGNLPDNFLSVWQ